MSDTLFFFLALTFLGVWIFISGRNRKKAAEKLRSEVVKGAAVMLTSGIVVLHHHCLKSMVRVVFSVDADRVRHPSLSPLRLESVDFPADHDDGCPSS